MEATTTTMEATDVATETMDAMEATEPVEAMEATTPAAEGCENYVVAGGDTLSAVAGGAGVSFQAVVDATNAAAENDASYTTITDPNILNVGQTLCIPSTTTAPAAVTETPSVEAGEATEETGAMAEAEEATTADKMMVEGINIDAGKAAILIENLSPAELIIDLTPANLTQMVQPTGKHVFIVDPGSYSLNVHSPGGGVALQPVSFSIDGNQVAEYIAFATTANVNIHDLSDMAMMKTSSEEGVVVDNNIVDVAVAAGNFQTLAEALTAAGLVSTLQGEGPFTVFAPTDEAFAALPEGTLEGLLADVPALTNVLLYHVASGAVPSSDVAGLESVSTLLGASVPISVVSNTVKIGDATILTTDIEAGNGVIHVIDAVLIPPADAVPAPAETATEEPATEEAMEATTEETTTETATEEPATEEAMEATTEETAGDPTLAPLPGKARVYLQNQFGEEVLLDIGGNAVKAGPDGFEYADLEPGEYTYTISIPGGAANGELVLEADQSILIRVDENGGVGSGPVYP